MNKIEELIAQKNYELQCLMSLKEIYDSGSCNDCAAQKSCKMSPKLGELVRYNCYDYKPKEEKSNEAEADETIRVGDEVVTPLNITGYVTHMSPNPVGDITCYIIWKDGSCGYRDLSTLTKTGRHSNEIENLIKKMENEE